MMALVKAARPAARSSARSVKPTGDGPSTRLQRSRSVALQRSACACGGTCPHCRGDAQAQSNIAISQPTDASEREADRIADHVMRAPRSTAEAQIAPAAAPAVPAAVPPMVDEVLRSPGAPLDAATRAF